MLEKLNNIDESVKLKTLNIWMFILVGIAIIWTGLIIFYVEKKTDKISNYRMPIIMVDSVGKIIDPSYTNLFPVSFVSQEKTNNKLPYVPLFESKDSYEIMDVIIVKFFYIRGVVIDKSGDRYTILYKDQSHIIQQISLPKEFLLSPTSRDLNPFSLLLD